MKSLLMVVVAISLAAPALADDHGVGDKGQFYITPGAILFAGPDNSRIDYDGHEFGAAGILGYNFSDRWSVEFLAARSEAEFDNIYGSGEDDIDLNWLGVMYRLEPSENWQPFVVGGVGKAKYSFDKI